MKTSLLSKHDWNDNRMIQVEEKILSYINNSAEEQLQFIIDLCDQNSYSLNKFGTDVVAKKILAQLENLFPHVQIIQQTEVGNFLLFKTNPSARAIYLIGHMDTVFPPHHDFQKCYMDGKWLSGPGTGDMKGGLAVIVFALKALFHANMLNRMNIVVFFNSDEEIGSIYSRPVFEKERASAVACLVAECSGFNNEIVVSRNGKMGLRIDSYGIDSHVAYAPANKASSILELAHKIIKLETLNADLQNANLNVGKIEGGLGSSTVPVHAFGLVDIRWKEAELNNILLEKVMDIIREDSLPGCKSEITVLNSRPFMEKTEGTKRLFELLQQTAKKLDQQILPEHRRGTSDANFFGSMAVPTLDGFGPVCYDDHTINERILISTIKERTKLLTFFLIDYVFNKQIFV